MMLKSQFVSFACIGAGASTVLMLNQLKNLQIKNIEIFIFEQNKKHFFGKAYEVPAHQVQLNTALETMSLNKDPEDYVKFCKKTNKQPQCRNSYAFYLEYSFQNSLQMLEQLGNKIIFLHEKVIFLDKKKDKIYLATDEKNYLFDYTLIATGASFRKIEKPQNFYGFWIPHLNAIFEHLSELTQQKKIGIFGASQSAIDAALILFNNGFKGNLQFYSPSGTLLDRKILCSKNQENCNEWLNFIKRSPKISLRKLIFFIFRLYPQLRKNNFEKAQFLEDITDFLQDLWARMDEKNQKEFIKKYQTWFRKERSALHPNNADLWDKYKDRVRIDTFKKNQNFSDFNVLINASGLDPDENLSFLSSNLRAVHFASGNTACPENCCLINAKNQKEKQIFIMGYPALGAFGFVNAIYFLKPQAEKIAKNLYQKTQYDPEKVKQNFVKK